MNLREKIKQLVRRYDSPGEDCEYILDAILKAVRDELRGKQTCLPLALVEAETGKAGARRKGYNQALKDMREVLK